MTKYFDFVWRKEVDQRLQDGAVFDRWTEDKESTDYEPNCVFKVDEYGFFVYWKSDGREGNVAELSQVSDIRRAQLPRDPKLADRLLNKFGQDVEDKMLAICSGLDYVTINYTNIVCKTKDEADAWLENLRKIFHNVRANNICPMMCLKKHWMRLGMTVDAMGNIPVKNIVRTFASGKTEKMVYQCLEDMSLPSGKGDSLDKEAFTFEKFFHLYLTICPRTDIDELFTSITKGEHVSLAQLVKFMNEKQRDPSLNEILYPLYDEKRCMEIITAHEPHQENIDNKRFSKDGLLAYLMSDENAPVFLDRLDIYQDMDQPLSHYYINSSHNTYLSGRQFGGKSTAEMYRQTLLAGCRLMNIVQNSKNLFATLDYACSIEYLFSRLNRIKNESKNTMGHEQEFQHDTNIPSISNKLKQVKLTLKEQFQLLFLHLWLQSLILDKDLVLQLTGRRKRMARNQLRRWKSFFKQKWKVPEIQRYASNPCTTITTPVSQPSLEDDKPLTAEERAFLYYQYTGATTHVHPVLSSYVNYCQPVKFQGFDVAEEKNVHHNMSSFSETMGLGYLKTQAIEFVNYNKRQMSRIYPKGARVDSSNYMPQVFWNAGCQMVSLNFQTSDLPMQLNQGKFEYNGNCGYLLKPDFMRRTDKTFDPFAESPVDGVIAAQVAVSVIAGQFLSDKKVGTYVEVDMYGLPTDTIRKEFRTRMIPGNGLNPQYNEEPFLFRKVVLPDLAVLRFGVFDENGKMLGQRILPLDGLQAGYRHISLRTEGNFPMSLPMLFCNIELKIYVPDGLGDLMDALSDPRAFLSAQEKREQQMKAMGIEASDIDTKALKGGKGGAKAGGAGGKPAAGAGGAAGAKKEEEVLEFDPINLETLRAQKNFLKATKKQQKELESMRKKHMKERLSIQKGQCSAIEKVAKGKKEVLDDPKIKAIVTDQMKQWSEMMEKHRKEEWEMLKEHLKSQEDILKKLMEEEQASQIKKLEGKHEQDMKDMKANQAKLAVETAKDVASDKTLKTKADRDRRLKEKNQNNTKRFIEERKISAMKQGKQMDKLKKIHNEQMSALTKDIQMAIQFYENTEAEYKMWQKIEFFC
ncbi:LOW QUALITY PROTEIN: 1-phosphatidylinositol 4,5-bisphosphate phosphodiesterase-like [Penaeus monodon]|uniref:LOW QUALITY PROTEIN: 1-phosphatidylinositol 4,5-bisphosphate phosphodiesterase-like n=1 Tax=Penaeus monodon TaxID=6687 RepID=UPI0018A72680|nr:LOW QUALITY PROTEIN: 1-phosphatidylinositol 4,5-bisphosphate phosphodiesterase-like [Penaeus monodon]